MTPKELRGEALFFGKARCSSCHAGPNFTDERFHNIGSSTGDEGLGGITGRTHDIGRFKTPTLREIARTAPYFHDGSKPTLEAVVDHYNTVGLADDMTDFELKPLGLRRAEKSNLVAFLKTLTGSTLPVNRRGTPLGELQLTAGGGTQNIWLVGQGFNENSAVAISKSASGDAAVRLKGAELRRGYGVTPNQWSGLWDRITFVLPNHLRGSAQIWVRVKNQGRKTRWLRLDIDP